MRTAERLLEERPLGEISVDDLASGAGISRPTFYFYFPSKDAVVLTLLDRLVEQASEARDKALARAAADPGASVRESIEIFYGTLGSHRALIRAAVSLSASNAEARTLWSQIMEGWVGHATERIEAARARGVAPAGVPARDLAIALLQMNERVLHAIFVDEEPAVAEDKVVDVLCTVWVSTIYGTPNPR
jgi:AcrR family transcriptional regulator